MSMDDQQRSSNTVPLAFAVAAPGHAFNAIDQAAQHLEKAWHDYDKETFYCKFPPEEYLRLVAKVKLKAKGVSTLKERKDLNYHLFVVGQSVGKDSHACDAVEHCKVPELAFVVEGEDNDGKKKLFTIKQGGKKEAAAFPCSREKSIKLISNHLISCGIEPLAFMNGNELSANKSARTRYSKIVYNSIAKSGYYVSHSSISFLLANESILRHILEQRANDLRPAIDDRPHDENYAETFTEEDATSTESTANNVDLPTRNKESPKHVSPPSTKEDAESAGSTANNVDLSTRNEESPFWEEESVSPPSTKEDAESKGSRSNSGLSTGNKESPTLEGQIVFPPSIDEDDERMESFFDLSMEDDTESTESPAKVDLPLRNEGRPPLEEKLPSGTTPPSGKTPPRGKKNRNEDLQALCNILAPGHDNLSLCGLIGKAKALKKALKESNSEKDSQITEIEALKEALKESNSEKDGLILELKALKESDMEKQINIGEHHCKKDSLIGEIGALKASDKEQEIRLGEQDQLITQQDIRLGVGGQGRQIAQKDCQIAELENRMAELKLLKSSNHEPSARIAEKYRLLDQKNLLLDQQNIRIAGLEQQQVNEAELKAQKENQNWALAHLSSLFGAWQKATQDDLSALAEESGESAINILARIEEAQKYELSSDLRENELKLARTWEVFHEARLWLNVSVQEYWPTEVKTAARPGSLAGGESLNVQSMNLDGDGENSDGSGTFSLAGGENLSVCSMGLAGNGDSDVLGTSLEGTDSNDNSRASGDSMHLDEDSEGSDASGTFLNLTEGIYTSRPSGGSSDFDELLELGDEE